MGDGPGPRQTVAGFEDRRELVFSLANDTCPATWKATGFGYSGSSGRIITGMNPIDKAPMEATVSEGFLTKREVAELLGRSVRTIEDWMQRRIIPFYRVGRAVRFRWSEIQAHFAARYRIGADGENLSTTAAARDDKDSLMRHQKK